MQVRKTVPIPAITEVHQVLFEQYKALPKEERAIFVNKLKETDDYIPLVFLAKQAAKVAEEKIKAGGEKIKAGGEKIKAAAAEKAAAVAEKAAATARREAAEEKIKAAIKTGEEAARQLQELDAIKSAAIEKRDNALAQIQAYQIAKARQEQLALEIAALSAQEEALIKQKDAAIDRAFSASQGSSVVSVASLIEDMKIGTPPPSQERKIHTPPVKGVLAQLSMMAAPAIKPVLETAAAGSAASPRKLG